MKLQKIRFALALPAGIMVMAAFTSLLVNLAMRLFELPQSMLDAKALMQKGDMPVGALLAIVAAWTVGAALGAFAACRVSGANFVPLSVAVAILSVAFVSIDLIEIPYPMWMNIAGAVLPPLAALAVGRLAVTWMPRARVS